MSEGQSRRRGKAQVRDGECAPVRNDAAVLMSHGPAGALAYMEILESWLIVDLHPRLCPFLSIWLQRSLTCLSFVSHLEDGEIARACLGSLLQRHRTLKRERLAAVPYSQC